MSTYARIVLLVLSFLLPAQLQAASEDPCACPEITCNSVCEIEVDVKFYSEQCDAGQRVRSCARPSCVKRDPLPNTCPKPQVKKMPVEDRKPASVVMKEPKVKVGVVERLVGEAWIHNKGEPKESVGVGSLISEKDVIETAKNARIEIRFDDGNLILLGGGSKVDLKSVGVNKPDGKKQTTLELLKGKIRSKVKKKYSGTNHYRIKTKSAVAGVRGTDFVVSYEQDENGNMVTTKVETLTGEVELASGDHSEKAIVGARETASYVVRSFSAREAMKDFMVKGKMSPVTKMSETKTKYLDKDMSVAYMDESDGSGKVERTVASEDIDIATCEKPKADFNQCSWTCVNNPKGESTCRTDLPEVECVRKVCKANGQWEDMHRLPASFGHSCGPSKPIIGPCDY